MTWHESHITSGRDGEAVCTRCWTCECCYPEKAAYWCEFNTEVLGAPDKMSRIKAILEDTWTPPRDTQWDTKYHMWIQNERVKAIKEVVDGR